MGIIAELTPGRLGFDDSTQVISTIGYAHHEKHSGSDFFVLYSVASLGAMTTPTDMITLTFTTPDTATWPHFTFRVQGTPGWRVRLIEGSTGGGATPTGSFDALNSDRNSLKTSVMLDVAGTPAAGKISYDATLLTGGKTLWDEYIPGSSGPQASGASGGHDEEIILLQDTTYQLSVFGTDTDPATMKIGWYEHTNKSLN